LAHNRADTRRTERMVTHLLSKWPIVIGMLGLWFPVGRSMPASGTRVMECQTTFTPDVDEAALLARFGPSNVAGGQVDLGEGQHDDGTILFGQDPEDRVEILWSLKIDRRRPAWLRVQGESSHWRSSEGLTLGLDLKSIERINGKPFRLLGFDWDYAGTVMSWSGGRLDQPSTKAPCATRVRLAPSGPAAAERVERQVAGEREFSSGHPAMQTLNPRVYDMWLSFPESK
jgi:hypothetical protein